MVRSTGLPRQFYKRRAMDLRAAMWPTDCVQASPPPRPLYVGNHWGCAYVLWLLRLSMKKIRLSTLISPAQLRTPAAGDRQSRRTLVTLHAPIPQEQILQLRLRQTRAFLEFRRSRKRPDHPYVRNTICVI